MRRWFSSLPRLIGRRNTHISQNVHLCNICAKRFVNTYQALPLPRHLRPYKVFQRISPPAGKYASSASSWLDLIEPCLPSHLRRDYATSDETILTTEPALTLNASDVAEILVAASHHQDHYGNLDLLSELAIAQGRWRAVVWITRFVAEAFAESISYTKDRSFNLLPTWDTTSSLKELTAMERGISIDRDIQGGWRFDEEMIVEKTSLDMLTSDKPENLSSEDLFRHDVWGCIWRTLGRLTLACAKQKTIAHGEMKPEILEIIALLHHHEIMPSSIYEHRPSQDRSALQQPPLLHLLSTRILTSLSDAAWRAREAEVIEESKLQDRHWFRPELASASYRVRVSGIKPEVWLELILWSCLHGGWITDGVSILRAISKDEQAGLESWKPMNWQDRLRRSLPTGGNDEIPDLASLKYVFDTRAASTMDLDANAALGLERTISSEVVSAYVEALVNNVRIGVGERGISPVAVLNYLTGFRKFLSRSKINLSNRSWDATALRLTDSGGVDLERSPRIAGRLPDLCPPAGEELNNDTLQLRPPYFWYGSALPHGIMHRTIDAQCRDGNLDGALRVFKALQDRTDHDKYRSIVSFFESQASRDGVNVAEDGFFTSPSSSSSDGVRTHPSLEHELPSSTLAMLMRLLLDAEAYNVANWFLYSNDVDGPVIGPERYADPTLAPILARLAINTENKDLLRQVMQSPKTHEVLSEVLNAHFKAGKWESAARVLRWTGDQQLPGFRWKVSNLIALADVMTSQNLASTSRSEGATARQIFAHILQSNGKHLKSQFDSVLLVLFAAHKEWAGFISSIQPEPKWLCDRYSRFQLNTGAFNYILQFIMRTYGLSAGQTLLYAVWPRTIRSQQRRAHTPSNLDTTSDLAMPKRQQTVLDKTEMTRNVLRIPHYSQKNIILYEGLRPNTATLRLFISYLCKEISDSTHFGNTTAYEQHAHVRQHVDWIARLYREYGLAASNFETDMKDILGVECIELDWDMVTLASRQFR